MRGLRRLTRTALSLVSVSLLSPVFTLSTAFASELAFSRNARTFEALQSSLMIKGLAHTCQAMTMINDALPCNPAMSIFTRKPKMAAQLLISNGYSTLEQMRKLLDGQVTQELVDSLFNDSQVLQIEGSGTVHFVSRHLSAAYVPANAKFFAVTRNEANPDVDLFAVQDSGFVAQTAYTLIDGLLHAGLQFRSINRQYIRKRFKLLDLTTEAGKKSLKPVKYNVMYFEPGLTAELPLLWPTRVSVMMVNSGFSPEQKSDFPTPPRVEAGFATTVPTPVGSLEIGFDYKSLSYEEPESEQWHLGSAFNYGSMYLIGGVDVYGISGGIFYGLEQVNAGIMYSTTKVPWNSYDYFAQTVYIQIGWQI